MNSSTETKTARLRTGLVLTLAVAIGAVATSAFWRSCAGVASGPACAALAVLLFSLTSWIGVWSIVATIGFVQLLGRRRHEPSHSISAPRSASRTAILVPVYNEDPVDVMARIQAMRETVGTMRRPDEFSFFVLSDSTQAGCWLEEECLWQQLAASDDLPQLYYRHRRENRHRKSGNIQEFCEQWGNNYHYMIVLDADSLMEPHVLRALVERMDADPQLGILQTPPLPLGDASILSRGQQFICRLCGPILARGLSWMCRDNGNYWGHNAIIRIKPFMRHCGLSNLPGSGPFGGEILSHDFVEAALMRRAGYKVRLDDDLQGSYEECPTTLPEYAQRDLRWCQGNLQHARLIISRSMPLANRLHFLTGVFAYLSSAVWMLFLMLSLIVLWGASSSSAQLVPLTLFLVTMALLLLPRVMAILLVASDKREREGFGGIARLTASTLFEFAFSVFMAPIMMALHTTFIVAVMRGHKVGWASQDRDAAGVSWREAWFNHRWHSMAGLALLAISGLHSVGLLLWLAPIWSGLLLSPAIAVVVSSRRLGQTLKRLGLLRAPEETNPPKIVTAYHAWRDQLRKTHVPLDFGALIADSRKLKRHVANLKQSGQQAPIMPEVRQRLNEGAAFDPAELDPGLSRAVLSDPSTLYEMHFKYWRNRLQNSE